MTPQIMRRDEWHGYEPRRQITFRKIILSTLALAMALVVVSNLQIGSADAAAEPQHTYEPSPAPVDSNGGGIQPDLICEPLAMPGNPTMDEVRSAEMEHAIGPGSWVSSSANDTEIETVWSANMTVGRATDSANLLLIYTGYFPLNSNYEGSLDDADFSLDGVDYSVRVLLEQQSGGTVRQLFFEAGELLPDDLVLQVGDDQFQVSESSKLGSGQNIHSWMLDESLGWEEGATMPVALMELSDPDPSPGPICPWSR